MLRGLLILVPLAVGCESRSDFPAAPGPITWTDMPLAPREGTVDGTGFKINLPPSAQPHVMGSFELGYDYSDLSVKVTVYQEAVALDDVIIEGYFEGTPIDNKQETAAEFSFTYNGGSSAFRYIYLGDGALSCKATAATLTPKLPEICASLAATTPLANPAANAPQIRTARCITALSRPRALEPSSALLTKKRKTKAEAAIAAELTAAYDRRQHACEDEKWSLAVLGCLSKLEALDNAKQCVATW